MDYDDRIKLPVFTGDTLYLNDFRRFNVKKESPKFQRDRAEPIPKPSKPYVPRNLHTFENWRTGVHVPFNLLWEPKPILGTNPHQQRKTITLEDYEVNNDAAIRTRPRLFMSPAVCIDDVACPNARAALIKDIYTTDWKKTEREVVEHSQSKPVVPGTTVESLVKPLRFVADLYPRLPAGKSAEAKAWDEQQPRACVHNTRRFWLRKPLQTDDITRTLDLVSPEMKTEIRGAIAKEALREPHDLLMPGYTGYRPRMSYGVSMRKRDREVVHPNMSVSKAICKRYMDDKVLNQN